MVIEFKYVLIVVGKIKGIYLTKSMQPIQVYAGLFLNKTDAQVKHSKWLAHNNSLISDFLIS